MNGFNVSLLRGSRSGGGTPSPTPTNHNDLADRDIPNCHPISAITGLQTALESVDKNRVIQNEHDTRIENANGQVGVIIADTYTTIESPNNHNGITVPNSGDVTLNGKRVLVIDDLDNYTLSHNDLTGRDVAGAHPISAITGLSDKLNSLNESGVWTPVLQNVTATYPAQVGRYIRIGNKVTVWCQITADISNVQANTYLEFIGLPYAGVLAEAVGTAIIVTKLNPMDYIVSIQGSSAIMAKSDDVNLKGSLIYYGIDISATKLITSFTAEYLIA